MLTQMMYASLVAQLYCKFIFLYSETRSINYIRLFAGAKFINSEVKRGIQQMISIGMAKGDSIKSFEK